MTVRTPDEVLHKVVEETRKVHSGRGEREAMYYITVCRRERWTQAFPPRFCEGEATCLGCIGGT